MKNLHNIKTQLNISDEYKVAIVRFVERNKHFGADFVPQIKIQNGELYFKYIKSVDWEQWSDWAIKSWVRDIDLYLPKFNQSMVIIE